MRSTYLLIITCIYFREEATVLFEPHLSLDSSFLLQKHPVIQIKLFVSLTLSDFLPRKFRTYNKSVLVTVRLRTI